MTVGELLAPAPAASGAAPPPPDPGQPFVEGVLDTPAGPAPRVGWKLTAADRRGGRRVRWGLGRDRYRVDPGLYALGNPGPASPVLATANYKLTFDRLRSRLRGIDAWLLVLDTAGVNVWCAAGKGTFGTAELARRVQAAGLDRVVTHRRIILPQLSAPGVAAHRVKEMCGFGARFGPVRAEDLPAYLANGGKASPEMRRVRFNLWDRAVVVPVELVAAVRHLPWIVIPFLVLAGLSGLGEAGIGVWRAFLARGLYAAGGMVLAVLAGAAAMPLFLPWLPGRAFSLKGLWTGLGAAAVWAGLGLAWGAGWRETAGLGLCMTVLASFLALNFTGASTYTSLSGVKKEMRRAVPLMIAGVAAGLALWLHDLFGA